MYKTSIIKIMGNQLIIMSKIRTILRLYAEGVSKKNISRQVQTSRNTVKRYIHIYIALNMKIEDINLKSDEELEEIFTVEQPKGNNEKQEELHSFFPEMLKELRRRGVTRQLMWQAYQKRYPGGYQFTQFCEYYNRWVNRIEPVMHVVHKAGDKMFVDYAGEKLQIVDKETGEIIQVEVFVSILGASQLTYVEATMSQSKEDFIMACEHAIEYYGGAPRAIVPDNLKSAVTRSDKYEPTLNEAFEDFVGHYGMTALPAGVYKPRHKALVEGVVKIIYTRIYAELRDDSFYSLEGLNKAIGVTLEEHNNKLMRGRTYSRRDMFNELEREELQPLPQYKYELKKKRIVTVMKNGHVCLSEDKHYYSVPYEYIGKKVSILYGQTEVEIYHKYKCIAAHTRAIKPFSYTTNQQHLASQHRYQTEWNPEKFISMAAAIDNDVQAYIVAVLEKRQHPEQGYRSCMGILSYARRAGKERLINACRRAMHYGDYSYKTIQMIIEKGLDHTPETEDAIQLEMPIHDNIRGHEYYK
jgi:transposase